MVGGLLELRPSQNVPGTIAMVPNLLLSLSLSLPAYSISSTPFLLSSLYRGDTVPISTSITVILLLVTEAIYISWSVARASVALKQSFRSDESTKSAPPFVPRSTVDISNTNSKPRFERIKGIREGKRKKEEKREKKRHTTQRQEEATSDRFRHIG